MFGEKTKAEKEAETKKAENSRKRRIKAETIRLNAIFEDIETKRKATILGLIQRAAFMRISLDDLEEDIKKGGLTELFQQGDQPAYQRERPVVKIYNTMNTSYQKIIKQLTDLLPKEGEAPDEQDEFDKF